MTRTPRILATLAMGAMLATAPYAAGAKPLTFASGWPPGGSVPIAIDEAVEWIAANSDLKPKHFPLSVLSFNETLAGLRDGVADIGYMLMPYFPKEFAESNLPAELTMLATSGKKTDAPGLAMSAALAEYIVLACPDCQTEMKTQNQVYLGGGSTPDYSLLCKKPIATPADLKGTKIRTGAANFGRWAENFDAIKVAISGAELYEAMSQGVVDCGNAAIPELINLRLIEVVTHVTLGVPGGVFAGVGSANVNRDTWKSLTEEQRLVLLRGGVRLMANINVGYIEAATAATVAAKEKGITFVEPSAELLAASAEFIDRDIAAVGASFASTYGVQNTDDKIATIRALVEKWKDLVNPVATDREAFAELLWSEIYSKVDIKTYGMN